MATYEEVLADLAKNPKTWLVTGVAGFIGSNLLERLLLLDQVVIGLDNLSTGYGRNLEDVRGQVSRRQWARFRFVEGDVRNISVCNAACKGVDYVLHQAALGSVPRSIADPVTTNEVNVSGFLNMLVAARDANVSRFVYAASSSTYGDHPGLPKVEGVIGNPLSPYAVSKYVNELYANVFSRNFGLNSIGLRYFNVFGKRQDPSGAYAAVIPRWVYAMINDMPVEINGDGTTARDFCFVDNAVQGNLLAATACTFKESEVFNIAKGEITDLFGLFNLLSQKLREKGIEYNRAPIWKPFRVGDVKKSMADISKAKDMLGYSPKFDVDSGLDLIIDWYIRANNQAA